MSNMKKDAKTQEMIAFDFSNLTSNNLSLQNCYSTCDHCDESTGGCNCDCDSDDCDCNEY